MLQTGTSRPDGSRPHGSRRRCAPARARRGPWPFVAFLCILASWPATRIEAQVVDPEFPVPNGAVFAMALDQGTLYIGGDFTRIGHAVGSAVFVDPLSGAVMPGFPEVVGNVYVIRPDGSGGWYLGGSFTSVGGLPRANLAHVTSTGEVSDWNPGVDGEVAGIVVHGTLVYLRGSFWRVGGELRNGLASVRSSDGSVTPWAPAMPGSDINTLVASDAAVYVGGDFYWWEDPARDHLVALDPVTAQALPWDAHVPDAVEALVLRGDTLFVGGAFQDIGGEARQGLAALSATTAALLPWTSSAWSRVFALATSDDALYVSGLRQPVGEPPQIDLTAIDAASGEPADWSLTSDNPVLDLAVRGGTLYVAGPFGSIGGIARSYAAAVDRTTGAVTTWNPSPDQYAGAVASDGTRICIGGSFRSLKGLPRARLAAIDVASGAVTDWNPGANARVTALLVNGPTVFAGGSFATVDGQTRVRAAAIDKLSGAVEPWNPGVNNTVAALAMFGSRLILAGSFTSIGGFGRAKIASIDPVTAVVDAWNPGINGDVNAIAIRDSTVYAGGFFTQAGGLARQRLAAIDAVTGDVTAWNPGATDNILGLAATDSTVIVAGSFNSIGGLARRWLAAVDRQTGQVTPWDPRPSFQVLALALDGRNVIAAGPYSNIGGRARSGLGAVDAGTGDATSWDPHPMSTVHVVIPHGSIAYAGGWFTAMGGRPQANLAAIHSLDPEVTVQDVSLTEGDDGTRLASFVVALSQPASGEASVDFTTMDGTATTADSDYDSLAGRLVFPAGETTRTIDVVVHGDTLREDDETFSIRLSNPIGAQILTPEATGTIVDDDLYRGGRINLFRAWSDAGDEVGLGRRYFVATPQGSFAGGGAAERARVIASWDGHVGDATFASPFDVPLEPGVYTGGAWYPYQSPSQPGLSVAIDGRRCAGANTSFKVREVRRDSLGTVNAFWATFEQHCDGVAPALRGEVAFNVDIALLVRTPQYRFAHVNTPVSFTVSALDARGEPVSLDAVGLPPGATFTDHGDDTATFAWPGGSPVLDTVTVAFRGTDATGHSSSSTTEIRIHGPDFVAFDGDSADFVTQGRSYLFHDANATLRSWSSGYGAVSVSASDPSHSYQLAFAAPVPRALSPGRWIADLRPNPPAIGLSGDGRGCNFSRGWFDVRQIVYGPAGQVESFWAVFERVCSDRGETWTRGEVRLNADTSLYVTPPADAFMTAGSDTALTVLAADTRGHPVALSMDQVPPDATFEDQGNGVGILHWSSVPAMPETMTVHFIATSSAGPVVSAPTLLHVADVGQPTAVLFSLLAADATPDAVELEWYAPAAMSDVPVVERREATGPWRELGEAVVSSDHLTFRDEDVAAGERYAYRLRLTRGGEAIVSAEASVEVPQWRLSLAPPRPNPVTGPLTAEFTLPRPGAAGLSLLDVAGRRLVHLDLGRMKAGRHSVPIAGAGALSPGLYWLTLRHEGESRTRTVVVTR